MMIITYNSIATSRDAIIRFIRERRAENPAYRVVDFGGIEGGSWSREWVDHVVDIQAGADFNVDLCRAESYTVLDEYVRDNGKWDLALCCHTLEDLYNPFVLLDRLPQLAHRGIISTPSLGTELSCLDGNPWLGYLHHRWIFDHKDGKMLVMPKLGWLERQTPLHLNYELARQEIAFEWQDELPYIEFLNNYMTSDLDIKAGFVNQLIQYLGLDQ